MEAESEFPEDPEKKFKDAFKKTFGFPAHHSHFEVFNKSNNTPLSYPIPQFVQFLGKMDIGRDNASSLVEHSVKQGNQAKVERVDLVTDQERAEERARLRVENERLKKWNLILKLLCVAIFSTISVVILPTLTNVKRNDTESSHKGKKREMKRVHTDNVNPSYRSRSSAIDDQE